MECEDAKMCYYVFDLNSECLLINPQIVKALVATLSNYWLIVIFFN